MRRVALWALLLAAPVGAQESAPPATAEASDTDAPIDEDEDEGVYTVVVVAERRVEMARQALYETARDAGFRRVKEKDDRVILRHDQPWKGDIVVHDDGRVVVKRQPVRFEPPVKNARPVDYLWCILLPVCIRPGGQTLGARKWKGTEARALATIRPEVERLTGRIGELGLARRLEDLPDRLDALWNEGESLDGGRPIRSMAERRAEVAGFWASRTDTPEGRVVRDAIRVWVDNTIQYSDHPFTAEELARVHARSPHADELATPAPDEGSEEVP